MRGYSIGQHASDVAVSKCSGIAVFDVCSFYIQRATGMYGPVEVDYFVIAYTRPASSSVHLVNVRYSDMLACSSCGAVPDQLTNFTHNTTPLSVNQDPPI